MWPTTNIFWRLALERSFSAPTLISATARTSWSKPSPTSKRSIRRPFWVLSSNTRCSAWCRCCWWSGGCSFAGSLEEFCLADPPAFVSDSSGWRRGDALPLQHFVHDFFLCLRALLLFEDVAAGQLATGVPPAFRTIRHPIQTGAHQPPNALAACRERR